MSEKPEGFGRAMKLLRRHYYDDVANYCERLDENNEH